MASNLASELNGLDDEDAALRRAIALSLGQDVADDGNAGPSQSSPSSATSAGTENGTDPSPTASSMAALGLDRKKMEEERLARLSRKRKACDVSSDRPDSAEPDSRGASAHQRLKFMDEQPLGPPRPSVERPGPSLNSNSSSPLRVSEPKRLTYPQGAVLKTWVRGVPADGDIKIEDVFQKDELQLAVLSSFQWDEAWLLSKLDMRKTKLMLIAYAKDEEQKAEMRSNAPETIRFVFPPMQGPGATGCMHSKLQLLKYPEYLRIVIPTGNLVPYDWGETGTMENMVFLIDLPRIKDQAERAMNPLTPFGEDLSYFLHAQGMDDKILQSLRNYDFSETSRYGFIHTIAGAHSESHVRQRTGYCGLGRSVAALGLAVGGQIDLDYVCSSIGSVNRELLTALYQACQGDSGMKEYGDRTGKPRNTKATAAAPAASADLTKIRVYFPSHETVVRSRGGPNVSLQSAGTICFQSKWWNSDSFPRQILRDSRNVRSGVLMHSKVMFVQSSTASVDTSGRGWAYVGSHNLSESAWGRLVKDRNSGRPKLNARNWECGVLVPVSSKSTSGADGDIATLALFRGAVPIPVELPGVPYHGNNKQPWFAGDH